MQTLGSPASLVAAIREDAAAEVERIEVSAASELAAIRERATSTSVAIVDRDRRLTDARRAQDERIARQEWEGRRAAMQQRETWLARVVEKAQELWRSGDEETRRVRLAGLIREARSRLPAGTCEVAVCDDDLDLADGASVHVKSAPIAGGCIVTSGDVSFDNSFEARARRLEPEWRNALSAMYAP